VPLGTVGLPLELRTYDEPLSEVERIDDESVDHQPLVTVRLLRDEIEIFRQLRVLAVGDPIAAQISGALSESLRWGGDVVLGSLWMRGSDAQCYYIK
jgi:hypothetical protein